MAKPFYRQPILNSPYHPPSRHHALGEDGQPLDHEPIRGRRRSTYITPVPKARKSKKSQFNQDELDLETRDAENQRYNPAPIINELRGHLETWRALPNPNDWGVTPATQRLLQHWRNNDWQGPQPFFCQMEAVETAIWLTEVARRQSQYKHIFRHLDEANREANPDLFRLALKLATGAGKTTVMAMLIAWQTVNAVRQPGSNLFTRGFLMIAPGITIRDRLRVLLPSDPDNYYRTRELVPPELMHDLGKAKIVITNYHAFQQRERLDTNKTGRAVLSGWREENLITKETEGEMLSRACGDLLSLKNVVVINDEAHHCYRERVSDDDEPVLKGDDREEAKKNAEAARLWISGIEALKRKVGVRTVYDLSATPFFLRGSGYSEGTLFPWVVSDFSLVEAIECGIVKLPRVPVADDAVNTNMPVYRELWEHIGKAMPKKGAGKSGDLDPLQIPPELQTALHSLYSHYDKEFDSWERIGIDVPPVFIVVCNNTASSKLVFEWISGWEREEDGETRTIHKGHLKKFTNFDDHGNRLPRMNTLLIDSVQIESGEALDANFKKVAASEIEQFKKEKAERDGAASARDIPDSELLREVMNTIGQKGRLGEQIRCVVSVSMLTEGWDANTVTHILGVRAFGTQLLCEQVIGRGLRRQSYSFGEEEDEQGNPLFGVEYADILGIPFDFATEPVDVPKNPPKPVTRVFAVKDRAGHSIRFPRVQGYRTELPAERLKATFSDDSTYGLTPEEVGPCVVRLEGVAGEGHDITPENLDDMRPATVAAHLSKRLVQLYFRDGEEEPPYHLYSQVQSISRRWVTDCLVLKGRTKAGMLTYAEIADKACALIYAAISRAMADDGRAIVKAMLDPYNPAGSTDFISFITSKQDLWETAPDKSHINYVVCDSDWEGEFARVVEGHAATLSYVKNQALGFEVPYLRKTGGEKRRYRPDFIVQLDDGKGSDDPHYLVVEVKGYRGIDEQIKKETMETLWIPGVNNLKRFGRWSFGELRDPFNMENDFSDLVSSVVSNVTTEEIA